MPDTRAPLGVAVLGTAMFHVQAWAEGILEHPRARLVGVWDVDQARGEALASAWGSPFFPADDLDALLSRRDVQAVAICAEHTRHASLAIAAAAGGKDVLCEKPMAPTVGECDRVLAACERAGVRYFQSFQMRFDPANVRIREHIQQGTLGRVSLARKRHSHGYDFSQWALPSNPPWFVRPEEGGVIADVGIHACDWFRWVFGEPTSVSAVAGRQLGLPGPDTVVATYQFADGLIGIHQASWAERAGAISTEVFGQDGWLVQMHSDPTSVHAPRLADRPVLLQRRGARATEPLDAPQLFPRVHARMVGTLLDCILADRPPPVTGADGRAAVVLMQAINDAIQTRQTVELGPGAVLPPTRGRRR